MTFPPLDFLKCSVPVILAPASSICRQINPFFERKKKYSNFYERYAGEKKDLEELIC